jgi:hypothetical protein
MKPRRPTQRKTGPVELTILLTSFIAATYAFGVYLFSTLLPEMRVALLLNYTEIGWITGVAPRWPPKFPRVWPLQTPPPELIGNG